LLENWASIQKSNKNNNIVDKMRNNIYYVKLNVIKIVEYILGLMRVNNFSPFN